MKRVIVVALAALSGCATKPENIAPLYVSEVPYISASCDQLRDTLLNVNTALANAVSRQDTARAHDSLGVFLVGLPVASMAGKDAEAQVATLKGHAEAIQRAGSAKKCGSLAPVIRWD